MLLTSRRQGRHQSTRGNRRLVKSTRHANRAINDSGQQEEPDLPKRFGTREKILNSDLSHIKQDRALHGGQASNIHIEIDEYGTELKRDARVWKVYVNEADKLDTELVKGWNDSTDVILIFAALFSAISTAFLIESSKLLQEDPAEVSAQNLLIISQTLVAIANGTQAPGPIPLPAGSPVEFTPSPVAVYVNALWFLSFSLSLATSFIAILAKDWCHSFISGRTGHPYSQTCRRQQKWNMIEKWKMSELLAVLPSLIHLALLLFSVGLCIHLWDTHTLVAVPVICVSGIAFGFYVSSSIAAIIIDFFPYSTIVSRLCRTKIVQRMFRPMILAVQPLAHWIDYTLHWISYWLVPQLIAQIQYLLALSGDALAHGFVWCILYPFWLAARAITRIRTSFMDRVAEWFDSLGTSTLLASDQIRSRFPKPKWSHSQISTGEKGGRPEQDIIVTSLALSWLIKNCEVPQSIDIALQAIAGASKDFYRQPLQECNATVEILRRLASRNPYRGDNTDVVVSLYSRALSYLSSSANQNSGKSLRETEGDLEVRIWDMQEQIEADAAELITEGEFQPSLQNTAALRIGNTAASRSLQFWRGGADSEDTSELFKPIIGLLDQHLNREARLHEAALLSLVNAAALFSLFSYDPATSSLLHELCMRIANDRMAFHGQKIITALVICALLQNQYAILGRLSQLERSVYLANAIHTLMELQSRSEYHKGLEQMIRKGPELLLESIEHLDLSSKGASTPSARNQPSQHLDLKLVAQLSYLVMADHDDNTTIQCLHVLHRLYNFTPTMDIFQRYYTLVIDTGYEHRGSTRWACWQILSELPFPDPLKLACYFYKTSRHDILTRGGEDRDNTLRFLLCGQAWLCLIKGRSLPAAIYRMSWLGKLLKHSRLDDSTGESTQCERLCDIIEQHWELASQQITKSFGVYAYRLMECVLQSRNCPIPQNISNGLRIVRQELRGLSSFMVWEPQSPIRVGIPGDLPPAYPSTQPGQSIEIYPTEEAEQESNDIDSQAAANSLVTEESYWANTHVNESGSHQNGEYSRAADVGLGAPDSKEGARLSANDGKDNAIGIAAEAKVDTGVNTVCQVLGEAQGNGGRCVQRTDKDVHDPGIAGNSSVSESNEGGLSAVQGQTNGIGGSEALDDAPGRADVEFSTRSDCHVVIHMAEDNSE